MLIISLHWPEISEVIRKDQQIPIVATGVSEKRGVAATVLQDLCLSIFFWGNAIIDRAWYKIQGPGQLL